MILKLPQLAFWEQIQMKSIILAHLLDSLQVFDACDDVDHVGPYERLPARQPYLVHPVPHEYPG